MSYKKFLKATPQVQDLSEWVQDEVLAHSELQEQSQEDPVQILRGAGFKIRLITSTAFGTQIDFAKKYEDSDIEKTLKNFNIKIKNKSVFIIQ